MLLDSGAAAMTTGIAARITYLGGSPYIPGAITALYWHCSAPADGIDGRGDGLVEAPLAVELLPRRFAVGDRQKSAS